MSGFLVIYPVEAKKNTVKTQWTFMVYMDADNNLDAFGYENMKAMQTVGSTPAVNIIVLWDKYDDVTNLYKVTTDVHGPELIPKFPLNGNEANMGDPETLQTFVDYTTKHFRAQHYALVFWDHGDDFSGCCWDDHPVDHLSHQEITQALAGIHLDLIIFDACVEGMIEVVYEYVWAGLQIDYVVATEGYVPNWGIPYATILGNLTTNYEWSAFNLAKFIVDDYIQLYETMRPASRLVELAVIDMSCINSIVRQLGDITSHLSKNIGAYHGVISEARGKGNMGWSEYGWEAYIDLPTFVKNLAEYNIQGASSLYDYLTDALYVQASHSMKSAEGLGIFFPNSDGSFEHKVWWTPEEYLALQFPNEGWWTFLRAYWGKESS